MRAIRDSAALQTIALIGLLLLHLTDAAPLVRTVAAGLWILANICAVVLNTGATRVGFILLQGVTLALIWLELRDHSAPVWWVLGSPLVWWGAHSLVRDSDREDARRAPFQQLLQALGAGWTQYGPRNPEAQPHVRVYAAPDGQLFYVGRSVGTIKEEYGKEMLHWNTSNADDVLRYANADSGVTNGVQRVLWVTHAAGAGDFESHIHRGVTVLFGDAPMIAAALRDFAAMRARLEGGQPTPGDLGRQVEEDAIAELAKRLPPGWRMRTRVLLAQGGDADIELTLPSGGRYVVDVKARTDRADLARDKGDRAKSWREIHTQVMGAARQLGGVPVVWQPRAQREDVHLLEGLWCVRGGPAALLTALEGLEGSVESDSPHAVLGIAPGATLEQIKAAYRDLARKYHPDRVSSLGEEFRVMAERRMKAINAAYRQLGGS